MVRSGWVRSFAALGAAAALLAPSYSAAAAPTPGMPRDDFLREAGSSPQGLQVGRNRRAVLLCRFQNPDSPSTKPLSYFEELYEDPDTGLLKYFEETSYGRVNMTAKVKDWRDLPDDQADYYNDENALFADCTAAHEAAGVDFSKFEAIDIIANDRIGDAHLGGRICSNAGSVPAPPGCWRMTIIGSSNGNDPDEAALWSHEMGHSFDLPHSSGTTGADYWGPMGSPSLWCFLQWNAGPTHGCYASHYLAAHKDRYTVNTGFGKATVGLGWIPKARRYVAKKGESKTVKVERLAKPLNNDNYLIARVPVPGKPFTYAVESRIRVGKFDSTKNLPGDGVVITKVNWKCFCEFPVLVFGKDKDGDFLMEPGSALWKPGETFRSNGVTVKVLGKVGGHAYKVRITVKK